MSASCLPIILSSSFAPVFSFTKKLFTFAFFPACMSISLSPKNIASQPLTRIFKSAYSSISEDGFGFPTFIVAITAKYFATLKCLATPMPEVLLFVTIPSLYFFASFGISAHIFVLFIIFHTVGSFCATLLHTFSISLSHILGQSARIIPLVVIPCMSASAFSMPTLCPCCARLITMLVAALFFESASTPSKSKSIALSAIGAPRNSLKINHPFFQCHFIPAQKRYPAWLVLRRIQIAAKCCKLFCILPYFPHFQHAFL